MAQPGSSSSPELETSSVGSPPEEPTVQALGAPKKRGPGILTVVLIVIVVVLAAALAYETFALQPKPAPPTPTIGPMAVQSANAQAAQGDHLSFTLMNLTVGDTVTAYMGDGGTVVINATASTSEFQYTYNVGGDYLVWVKETAPNGTVVSDTSKALLHISVVPSVPASVALLETAPEIYFNSTYNPKAPIVGLSSTVSLFGAMSVNPAANSQDFFNSVNSYVDNTTTHTATVVTESVAPSTFIWDFGNGNKATVPVDTSAWAPMTNPENISYSTAGLYTTTLTLINQETETVNVTQLFANGTYTANTTQTSTIIASYSFTVGQTVAVGSYAIAANFTPSGSAGVITEVVNSPGGPYSFDPQIDYETTGAEVVFNTMGTLLFYDANSTTQFIPYIADTVPTISNGGITNNNQTYTFHIGSGMHFSNGDPITAYDVYYTFIRSMLFQGGYPGTANWINAQYLLEPAPAGPYVPFTPLLDSSMSPSTLQSVYNAINSSITYDNTANTVTFHLWKPYPASLFFTAIVDPLGSGILDAAWLQSVGAGITFSPQGFLAYENQANEGNYNANAQFGPVASGPYTVSVYTPGTAVVLKPNPGFPGTSGIPKAVNTVVLKWALDENVAYQLYVNGQADIATLLPPAFYPRVAQTMGSSSTIYGPTPALTEYFGVFNLNISQTALSAIGSGYTIPSNYFANPYIREAFADTYNYTNFIDNVLGNKKYGYDFGSAYCGVIIPGLPYHTDSLTGCPAYDLARAKSLLYLSGQYNTTVNFPVIVNTGDPFDYTMTTLWADAIHSIDPAITFSPAYLPFSTIIGDQVPGANGMPFFFLGWIADYPYPSDFTDAMYLVNGTYPGPNGWDVVLLGQLSTANGGVFTTQFNEFNTLITQLHTADLDTNPTQAAADYQAAEQTAVNLYMYVYTYQFNSFWIVRSYMHPYQNNWGYQTAPTMGAAQDSLFFYWVKG